MPIQDTIKNLTGETPFSHTYGMEEVILVEMNIPIVRIASYNTCSNGEVQVAALDLIKELRDQSYVKSSAYRRSTMCYHNRTVKEKSLQGHLVLCKASISQKSNPKGKLLPNWEGCYIIHKEVRK